LTSNDQQLKYQTMLLLLRHEKPVNDTLFAYFASLDEYRYNLYHDLQDLHKSTLFPKKYESMDLLVKAKLIASNENETVDTVQLLDKVWVQHQGQKGYIYLYKYKEQKEDPSWKIATVGLVPAEGTGFEILRKGSHYLNDEYDFTGFSSIRVEEDQPLSAQLQKVVKKMLYSKRKSAAEFYESDNDFVRTLFQSRY
jgi:hypothetical protein